MTVSVPVVLPAGIVSGEQVSPGVPAGQVIVTAVPGLGANVMVDVPLDVDPVVPAVVATVTALPLTVNDTALTVNVGGVALVSGPPPGCGLKVSTLMT